MTKFEVALQNSNNAAKLIEYLERRFGPPDGSSDQRLRFQQIVVDVGPDAVNPLRDLVSGLRIALGANAWESIWNRLSTEWQQIRSSIPSPTAPRTRIVLRAFDTLLLAVGGALAKDETVFKQNQRQCVGCVHAIDSRDYGFADQ